MLRTQQPGTIIGKLFPQIRHAYEKADHVVFQSEQVRSVFEKSIREKSSILKNPVMIPEPADDKRKKKIVTMGRLTSQKNHVLLIRSFAGFYRRFPGYTLHLFGDGELSDDLQALAASLGIRDAVQFHGHVRDIHEAIADAEIFALSSSFEGLSNALLECMMMGFPCVSTRCEGSVDVIRSGENGLLVDKGSDGQMAAALALLADDPGLRQKLGAAAKETAERYRTDLIIAQWKELTERMTR